MKKKAQFKSPRSRLINDLFQMKKAMDVIESKPTKLFVQSQYEDAAKKILANLGCKAAEPEAIAFTFPPNASCHFEKISLRAMANFIL